jgi:Skp family chaperone for outer membrane proteins
MKNIALAAVFAATILTPVAASAQAVPAATVAVVDLEKVTSQCTACKTAQAALQGQVNALKSREQALAAPLQTEGKAIQAAIDALPQGKEPDAALQARIKAFQTKQQQGSQELARQQQQVQRNQAYISQQISSKLGPIYQQVMQRRGANVMVEIGTTLASGAALDVSNDVLAALNQQLPSVATTAPAQAAPAQQKPQGR